MMIALSRIEDTVLAVSTGLSTVCQVQLRDLHTLLNLLSRPSLAIPPVRSPLPLRRSDVCVATFAFVAKLPN